MIATLVRFSSNLTDDEVQTRMETRADSYRNVPGLRQKIYLRFRDTGEFGALYLWDSEQSLVDFRDTELARTIPEVYDVTALPRSDLADVCLVVQPATGRSSVTA